VLVTNEPAGVSNNPDGTFVTWETLDAGRARLIPRKNRQGQFIEIEGTTDWLLEVVRDGSARKDLVQLRRAYHRAEVPEYWLIDARGEEIDFQIHLRRSKKYVAGPSKDGWHWSPLFRRWFRMTRTVDRAGMWRYRLDVKEV
jgi:Uma2 family endonuclease